MINWLVVYFLKKSDDWKRLVSKYSDIKKQLSELRLYPEFQLPNLCLSCISIVKEEKIRGRRRKESAVLEATLAQLNSS